MCRFAMTSVVVECGSRHARNRCWGSNLTSFVSTLQSVVSIAAGAYHTCALTSSNDVK